MKKVLITGGSSGIGKAFAQRYASEGYEVTIVSRSREKLEKVLNELPKNSGSHRFISADISTDEGTEIISKELRNIKYNVLVNNAGAGAGFGFTEIPIEKLHAMIRLNCNSVVSLSHTFLENAVAGDSLINIGSIVSFIPYPGLAVYSATKAFVLSFTESLFAIYNPKGIKILAVCPGTTDTNFFIAAGENEATSPSKSGILTPEKVVNDTLVALKMNKVYVVNGVRNKLMVFLAKGLPTKLVLWLSVRW